MVLRLPSKSKPPAPANDVQVNQWRCTCGILVLGHLDECPSCTATKVVPKVVPKPSPGEIMRRIANGR